MTRPSLAVAVATLDRPEGLRRCLEALVGGTAAPDEIVVVDQGDAEATAAVIASVSRGASAIRHVQQRTRCLSASRNAALDAVSADVLAVTDDDCVPDAGWVAALLAAFSEPTPPDGVAGRVLPLGPERPDVFAVSSRRSTERRDFFGRALPWHVGTGANFAVLTQVARAAGGYDARLGAGSPGGAGEDVDFVRRLLRAGARLRYEPEAVVRHERQSRERRRATRTSYGRGIGACCALAVRSGDAHGMAMLAAWVTMRMRLLVRAALRGDRRALGEELLVLRGTIGGLVYGALAR